MEDAQKETAAIVAHLTALIDKNREIGTSQGVIISMQIITENGAISAVSVISPNRGPYSFATLQNVYDAACSHAERLPGLVLPHLVPSLELTTFEVTPNVTH